MSDKSTELIQQDNNLYEAVRDILQKARQNVVNSINSTLVRAYWQVGRHIVEFEQGGAVHAQYGKATLKQLSAKLTEEFGSGFTVTNLVYMRQFYTCFPIYHTLCDKLSWSHCRTLLKVQDNDIRLWYLNECICQNWTVRQLDRQINTLFYERMLASQDKNAVLQEINTSAPDTLQPREIIRDPYVLDFIGIPQSEHFLEGDLEQMLISKLQHFLLELGKGYSFVARQKRISFDNKHFFIDLVFYNYLARCFVLIDLKTDELTHQDIGQMQMYVNYYTRELMNPGDNPPIGILLCADKNDAVVKYTLPEGDKQIFASKYITYLPTKEELEKLLSE